MIVDIEAIRHRIDRGIIVNDDVQVLMAHVSLMTTKIISLEATNANLFSQIKTAELKIRQLEGEVRRISDTREWLGVPDTLKAVRHG